MERADWVVAKWGQDSAVYYIGNLASGTEITLTLGGTGFDAKGAGLSHYTLFNGERRSGRSGRRLRGCDARCGPGWTRPPAAAIR